MRNRPNSIVFGLILVLLIGCSSLSDTSQPTAQITESTQISLTPQAEEQSLHTCEMSGEVTAILAENYGFRGSLAYLAQEIYLVGGTLLTAHDIPTPAGRNIDLIGFSPDGQWLAYSSGSALEGIPYQLHLLGPNGESSITIPKQEIVEVVGGSSIGAWSARWISNEYLHIQAFDPGASYGGYIVEGILDAFSGEWNTSLLEELPGYDPDRDRIGDWMFSPDLTRVLYVASEKQEDGTRSFSLVLLDKSKQKELWRNDGLYSTYVDYGGHGTAWSPDGTKVAFVGLEAITGESLSSIDRLEVYIIDQDGEQLESITDLLPPRENIYSFGLSWSHDSRYLAFMVSDTSAEKARPVDEIYVFDSWTHELLSLCQRTIGTGFLRDAPVWSPDGNHIAYVEWDDPHQDNRYVRVLDVFSGELVTVADHIGLLGGWSSETWTED